MENVLRTGLFIAALSTTAATIYLGYLERNIAAGTTGALTAVLCAFVFLTRFKRFKGLGFEGELWEQEMEKAATLRKSLQELTKNVAEVTYWSLGEGARIADLSYEKLAAIVERSDHTLIDMGMSADQINQLKRPWHKCIMYDLSQPILAAARDKATERRQAVEAEIQELRQRAGIGDHERSIALTPAADRLRRLPKELNAIAWSDDYEQVPQRLREKIDGFPEWDQADRQAIYEAAAAAFLDIDYYAQNKVARRPEVLES